MFEDQTKIVNVALERIKEKNNCKLGQVWDIRKGVIGGKKSKIMATTIINPTTGKLIVGKRDIQETTLNYCMETLRVSRSGRTT